MSEPRQHGLGVSQPSTDEESVSTSNPLDLIELQHAGQESLCDALEEIADSLPGKIDAAVMTRAVAGLSNDLPLLQRDMNEGVFPLLQAHCLPEDRVENMLPRLMMENTIDLSFAGEIIETLSAMVSGTPVRNPNTLGYMLRGFFESYRRHLHWESTVILPIARKRFSEGALRELAERMRTHRSECEMGREPSRPV
jgi:Hemerythrin HHE cation binding domain